MGKERPTAGEVAAEVNGIFDLTADRLTGTRLPFNQPILRQMLCLRLLIKCRILVRSRQYFIN